MFNLKPIVVLIVIFSLVFIEGCSSTFTELPDENFDKAKEIIDKYNLAYVSGDIDTLRLLNSSITIEEEIYVSLISPYLKSFTVSELLLINYEQDTWLTVAYLDVYYTGASNHTLGEQVFLINLKEGAIKTTINFMNYYNKSAENDEIVHNIEKMLDNEDIKKREEKINSKIKEDCLKDKVIQDYYTDVVPAVLKEWKERIKRVV